MMIQGVLDVKKEKKCWNNYGLIKVLHLAFASLESLGQDKTFKSSDGLSLWISSPDEHELWKVEPGRAQA